MAHIFIGNFLILPAIITVSLPFKDFKDNLVLFVTIRKMLCRSSTKRATQCTYHTDGDVDNAFRQEMQCTNDITVYDYKKMSNIFYLFVSVGTGNYMTSHPLAYVI